MYFPMRLAGSGEPGLDHRIKDVPESLTDNDLDRRIYVCLYVSNRSGRCGSPEFKTKHVPVRSDRPIRLVICPAVFDG